jgi:hypothetical protein
MMKVQPIDWYLMDRDMDYRAEVLNAVMATQAGRDYMKKIAELAESELPFPERYRLKMSIGLYDSTYIESQKKATPAVSGIAPAVGMGLRNLGRVIGTHTMRVIGWSRGKVTPLLEGSWKTILAGNAGRAAVFAASAFFATDYVISKLKGDKPEIEKLYQTGREVLGSTVSTTSTVIKLLPVALIAWGAYSFIKVSK